MYRTIAVLKPLDPGVSFVDDILDTDESDEEIVCLETETVDDTESLLSSSRSYRAHRRRLREDT